ncbi:MAG: hypothetical protein HY557_07620 [Euryarchaeota archaeon]|nr:hypothetical protein [Euryarchaeota archaeon]
MPGSQVTAAIRRLRRRVDRLTDQVEELGRTVEQLRVSTGGGSQDVLIIEEMSKQDVRERVLDILAAKETTDIVELHETIRYDIQLLAEVLDELRAEGQISDG